MRSILKEEDEQEKDLASLESTQTQHQSTGTGDSQRPHQVSLLGERRLVAKQLTSAIDANAAEQHSRRHCHNDQQECTAATGKSSSTA